MGESPHVVHGCVGCVGAGARGKVMRLLIRPRGAQPAVRAQPPPRRPPPRPPLNPTAQPPNRQVEDDMAIPEDVKVPALLAFHEKLYERSACRHADQGLYPNLGIYPKTLKSSLFDRPALGREACTAVCAFGLASWLEEGSGGLPGVGPLSMQGDGETVSMGGRVMVPYQN